MKLIIAGSRDFNDYALLCDEVNKFISNETNVTIISGLARGADKLGCQYASDYGFSLEGFSAQWKKDGYYNPSAGLKRNKLMAKNADALIAFWDGKSTGTQHMIDYALEKNLKVKVINYET